MQKRMKEQFNRETMLRTCRDTIQKYIKIDVGDPNATVNSDALILAVRRLTMLLRRSVEFPFPCGSVFAVSLCFFINFYFVFMQRGDSPYR